MTTNSLENAFADVELGADRALRAATALVAQTKRLVKAAREGDLRKLQTAGRELQEQAREACAQAEVACAVWTSAAPPEVETPARLATELRELARAAGLAVQDIDGAMVAFPVVVRQSGVTFRFNKRKVPSSRPSVLVAELKKAQQRKPDISGAKFLEMLHGAYTKLARSTHGQTVLLREILDLLFLTPAARDAYSEADFLVMLLELQESRQLQTRSGHRLTLPASTGTRGPQVLSIPDRDGRMHMFYGVRFEEEGA